MATDLFQARGIKVDQPRDLFQARGVKPPSEIPSLNSKDPLNDIPYYASGMVGAAAPDWEQLKTFAKNTKDIATGAAESGINAIPKIVNLVKKNPLPLADISNNSPASNLGKGLGEAGTFFLPGGTVNAVGKLSRVAEPVNALAKTIGKLPFVKSGASVAKNALNAGVLSATQNPEDAGNSFKTGSEQGALAQTAINALTSQIPIVKILGKAGLGYAGYRAGETLGHPDIGAAIGALAPTALKSLGLGGKNVIPENALNGLKPEDVEAAVMANRRLGTPITPAQASGNYPKAAQESAAKRSIEGGQEGYRQEKIQEDQQRKAINNTLDKIYKPTTENEKAINDAYDKANQLSLNKKAIDSMKENPVMREAFENVGKLPAFKNIPENNYKYLAQVERILYKMQKGADNTNGYIIGKVKDQYSKFLEEVNPDYAAAKRLAQPRIVRRNIEDKLNKNEEDYTGKNFYSKFLNNRANTAKILQDVRRIPEAKQAIQDMRAGWKHLSNIKTVSQSGAQAQAGISQARDPFKAIIEHIKNFAGAKDDVKAVQYIHSHQSEWFDDFDRIAKIKSQPERNRKWLTLIGGIAEGAGLTHQDDGED